MLLYGVQDGRTYDVSDLPSDTTVEQLTTYLVSPTGLEPRHQILICNGKKLDPKRLVSSYANEDKIYIFNREQLLPTAHPPAPVIPVSIMIEEPQAPASVPSTVPAWAHAFYIEFYKHLTHATFILQAGEKRFSWCTQCVAEQYVQTNGLATAVSNLSGQSKQLSRQFAEFASSFQQQTPRHQDLLDHFEDDLERLQENILPPALQGATHARTLRETVPEPALRNWHKECTRMHGQMVERVNALDNKTLTVLSAVEKEAGRPHDVNFPLLETELAEAESTLSDEQTILESFRADLQFVSRPDLQESELGALEEKLRQHRITYLPSLLKCDTLLSRSVEACAASKTHLSQSQFHRLRAISAIQNEISKIANTVSLFTQALKKKASSFAQLYYTRKMPAAYRMFLHEIVRRRTAKQDYIGHLSQIGERMAKLRSREMSKREAFQRKYSKYLPQAILEVLNEQPPYIELQAPAFDTKLPDVDPSDIDTLCSESSSPETSTSTPPGSRPHSRHSSSGSMATPTGTAASGSINGGAAFTSRAAGTSGSGSQQLTMSVDLSATPLLQSIMRRAELSASFDGGDSVQGGGELELSLQLDHIEATLRESAIKDQTIRSLKDEMQSHTSKITAYEDRIRKLEDQLREAYAVDTDGVEPAPAAEHQQQTAPPPAAPASPGINLEVQRLRGQVGDLETQLEKALSMLQTAEDMAQANEKQHGKVQEQVKTLELQITAQKTQLSERSVVEEQLRGALTQASSKLAQTQAELKTLQEHKSQLDQQLKATSAVESDTVAHLRESLSTAQSKLQQCEEENVELKGQVKVLTKETESMRTAQEAALHTSITEAHSQVMQLVKEKDGLKSELALVGEEAGKMKAAHAQHTRQLQQRDEQIAQLTSQSKELQQQAHSATQALQGKEEEIGQLKGQFTNLQQQLAARDAEVEDLHAERAKLLSLAEAATKDKDTLAQQLEESELQVAQAMDSGRRETEDSAATLQSLQDNVAQLKSDLQVQIKASEGWQGQLGDEQRLSAWMKDVLIRIYDIVETEEGAERTQAPEQGTVTDVSALDLDDLVARIYLLHARATALAAASRDQEQQEHQQKQQPQRTSTSTSTSTSVATGTVPAPTSTGDGSSSMSSSNVTASLTLSTPPTHAATSPALTATSEVSTLSDREVKEHRRAASTTSRRSARRKISFLSFALGDIAVFFPVDSKRAVYSAFNWKCPHYYLSVDSLHTLGSSYPALQSSNTATSATSAGGGNGSKGAPGSQPAGPSFVIGEVIAINTMVVSEGGDNPYHLPSGTKYHVVDVAMLEGMFSK